MVGEFSTKIFLSLSQQLRSPQLMASDKESLFVVNKMYPINRVPEGSIIRGYDGDRRVITDSGWSGFSRNMVYTVTVPPPGKVNYKLESWSYKNLVKYLGDNVFAFESED
jgi:hypothetical protein